MSQPPPSSGSPPPFADPGRLDSWKEIAAYLKRDVTTVQRWEKREGMPVHRHLHDKMGSVYAFRNDLDAWARSRHLGLPGDAVHGRPPPEPPDVHDDTLEDRDRALHSRADAATTSAISTGRNRWTSVWLPSAVGLVLAAGAGFWQLERRDAFWKNPITAARYFTVTDFGGTEQAAAISRDGRFVAFLSDRDGRADVWITQVGTGQFYNLTRGDTRERVNPSVRTLGFSADGALVTYWVREPEGSSPPHISIWAVPILGGQPRPYLEGVAEFDWSADGSRLAYHTPGPGDPMFVRGAGEAPEGHRIFAAPPGLHSHFLQWSMDGASIYFVQGSLPDRMDIWRIRPDGRSPERITYHDSRVSHPVFLDARTLMYLASDPDGSGPWLYTIDVERRIPHRVSSGVDRYTSLAASANGRRLVATVAGAKRTFWRLPITGAAAEASAPSRIPLTTATGFCPRMGPGYLVYVSSKGPNDSIWKLLGQSSTELWSAPDARIIGCPAVAPDGARLAFSIRQKQQALLCVMNLDGTGARIVGPSLEWQGAPAWAPDGHSLMSAAVDGGVPRLFRVPLDGGPPVPFVRQHSVDPVWSPDGRFVVFSGPDIGGAIPVSAATADSGAHPLPNLTLARGARHLCFLPGRRELVVLRGSIRHKNLWAIDLSTAAERQLTHLPPDFEVRDFDVSPDGREVVLEQWQERSDVVLLDAPLR